MAVRKILVAIYLALVLLTSALPFLPGGGPTSGVIATLLTLPWSALGVAVLDAVDPGLIDRLALVVIAAGALLNGILLYLVLGLFTRGGTGDDEELKP